MIFVYNETELQLQLHSLTKKGTGVTELRLEDENRENSRTIITTKDSEISESMKNKYGKGRPITYNPSKEFVLVAGKKILVDPATNSMVVSKLQDDNGTALSRPDDLVKNIIVLVIKRGTRFFFPTGAQLTKPVISSFGKDYTIAVLYVKSFNWSVLTRPLSVLIKSAIGEEKNMELKLTSVTHNNKNGALYAQNTLVAEQFTGEFPIRKVMQTEKPATDNRRHNNTRGQQTKSTYQRNTKAYHAGNNTVSRGGYSHNGYANSNGNNTYSKSSNNKSGNNERRTYDSRSGYNNNRTQKRDGGRNYSGQSGKRY